MYRVNTNYAASAAEHFLVCYPQLMIFWGYSRKRRGKYN